LTDATQEIIIAYMLPLDGQNRTDTGAQKHRHAILIVEDETLVGWSLANALKKVGFDVTILASGEPAIEKIGTDEFSVVITDARLPHLDGFQVAAAAKKRSFPVIMITAIDDEESRSMAAQAGINYFIEKPFDLNEMTMLVTDLVQKEHLNKH
jgi:DNA-binding response OmpR family regulator